MNTPLFCLFCTACDASPNSTGTLGRWIVQHGRNEDCTGSQLWRVRNRKLSETEAFGMPENVFSWFLGVEGVLGVTSPWNSPVIVKKTDITSVCFKWRILHILPLSQIHHLKIIRFLDDGMNQKWFTNRRDKKCGNLLPPKSATCGELIPDGYIRVYHDSLKNIKKTFFKVPERLLKHFLWKKTAC